MTTSVRLRDASGTLTTGGTAQVVLTVDPGRKFLLLQNRHASDTLYGSFTGTAAAGSPSSFSLGPGGALDFENASCTGQALSLVAINNGHPYFLNWD